MSTSTPPQAGRREWLGLVVLALPTLLASVDLTVLYLALPHLSADLHASTTQQLWIVDVFGFMVAGLLVTMGNLGDRIGNRKLLLIGSGAFAVISAVAAYSNSPVMLIVMRALMGIAAAAGMPPTLALISHMFKNPAQRGIAIAAWMSCFMAGLILGPLVGGALLQNFWWGSVFLLALPVMAVVLVAAPFLIPEHRNPAAGKLDLFSVALVMLAVMPVVWGLKTLARDGWKVAPIVAVMIGVGFGVAFVMRQQSLEHPLLDLRLFSIKTLRAALVLGLLVGALNGGTSLLVTQHLQIIEGLSPLNSGLWLLPPSLAMMVGLFMAPALIRRLSIASMFAVGLAIAAIGYLILSRVDSGNLGLLVTGFAVMLFGMGLPLSQGTALVMGSAPPHKIGSAAALQQTGNEFGIALGIATLGSIGMAVYRSNLTIPSGLSADQATTARGSVAGAFAVSQQGGGATLANSAKDAFTSGLNMVAAIAAVIMLCLAVASWFALRHVTPPAMPGAGGPPAGPPAAAPAAEGEDLSDSDSAAEQTADASAPGARD